MSNPSESIKLIFIGFAGGIFLITDAFTKWRLRRLVENMPTSPIQSAAQGLVEFQGAAYPLSNRVFTGTVGQKIVYSEIHIQKYLKRGRSSTWNSIYKGIIGDRFIVRDRSGSAHVLMKGADLKIKQDIYQWEDLDETIKSRIITEVIPKLNKASFFVRDWLSSNQIGEGRWRVQETTINVGECVYVLGAFQSRATEPTVEIINEHDARELLAPVGGVLKNSNHPLIISDCHQEEFLKTIGRFQGIKIFAGCLVISITVLFVIFTFLPKFF